MFFSGLCFCGTAQDGPSIPFLNTTPYLDGDLREWNSTPTVSFTMTNQPALSANQADVWLGFDETNLYGAFFVHDARLVQIEQGHGNPLLYHNDGVELYLDTKNDTSSYMDANDFQIIMDASGQLVVFRGGDTYQIKATLNQVPKDTITSSFIMDYAVAQHGTLNKDEDEDVGYSLEFRIPWASLGLHPRNGYRFKIDICLNDVDTLLGPGGASGRPLSTQMNFQSMTGSSNFGFPKNWQTAILHGESSRWHRFKELHYLPPVFLSLVSILVGIVVWLGIRNRQLRQVPRKAAQDIQLVHFFFEQEPVTIATLPHQELFTQTREIVLQHLNQDLSPTALAAQLFIGLRQLQRIFKDELQTTPNAFIISIKMEEAARRLNAGDVSTAELAYVLGFADPAYFARVFKKYFGCSPTVFAERRTKPGQ